MAYGGDDAGFSFQDAVGEPQQQESQGFSFDEARAPAHDFSFQEAMGQEPQPQTSALGAGVRGFARGVIPTVAGAIAGVGAGIVAAPTAPFTAGVGPLAAGLGAGMAAGAATRAAQDKLLDATGLDSPESRAQDATEHPYASLAGSLAPAIVAFQPGAIGSSVAQRGGAAAIMGGIDLGQQAVTKGVSNIDPTEVAASAATGFVLPKARSYVESAGMRGAMAVGARPSSSWSAPSRGDIDPTVAAAAEQLGAKEQPQPPPGPEPGGPGTPLGEGEFGLQGPQAAQRAAAISQERSAPGADLEQAPWEMGRQEQPPPPEQTAPPEARPEPAGPGAPLQEGEFGYQSPRESLVNRNTQSPGEDIEAPWEIGDRGEADAGRAAVETSQARSAPAEPVQTTAPEKFPGRQVSGQNENKAPAELSLLQHLASRGGIAPSGETKTIFGSNKKMIPGYGALIRKNGMSLDDALQAAKDGKYLIDSSELQGGEQTLGHNDLLDLLDREARGDKQYPVGREGPAPKFDADQYLHELGDHLDSHLEDAGIDPKTVPADIRDRALEIMAEGNHDPVAAYERAATEEAPLVPAQTPVDKVAADILKPQPRDLSAGATDAAGTYQAPPGEVKALNGSTWMKVNKAFDNLFSLPRWIFAPHTISDKGMQADRIVNMHMGDTKGDLAKYQGSLADMQTYFHRMDPNARTSAVTEYENGAVDPQHPAAPFMKQARTVSDQLNNELTRSGDTSYVRQSIPSFFEKAQQNDVRDWITQFQEDNNRAPTLGEAMKKGFKLQDDLLNADGSPDPQKVIAQQNFAKSQAIERAKILRDASEGRRAEPGVRAMDPLLHDSPKPGDQLLDTGLTNGAPKYAAPEVKAVLERYFNPSVRDPTIRNAYQAWMRLKTGSNALALIGGVYHMRFMLQEAWINEVARGMGRMLNGEVGGGAKDIGKAITAPYSLYKEGKNSVLDAIMHPESVKDPFDKVVVNVLKEGGQLPPGRIRGMNVTPELETGAMQGLTTGWKPAFEQYLRDQVQAGLKIKNKAAEGNYLGVAKDSGLASIRALTEGMQQMMHPLFNNYIPLMKAGANFRNLKQFMLDNPGLSHDEYVDMARKFVHSTDNAMGELNQSTLYAPGWLKAIGNGTMVSLGWNVGDVKQFLGGARQFVRDPNSAKFGKDFDPRVMYIPAFIAVTALSNIAYQLLKTGEGPRDLTDVIAPRTGAKTKAGNPERVLQPGYEKDVLETSNILGGPEASSEGFRKYAYNKLAALPKTLIDEIIYNQNFAGRQIANPNDPFAKRMSDYLGYFVKNALEPIMVKQAGEEHEGSAIGPVERALGNRNAPKQWQDPEKYQADVRKRNDKAAEAAKRFHKITGY